MKKYSFLFVGGYISTGSTPLICLLNEYENIEVLEGELRVGEDGLFYLIGKLYKGEQVDQRQFNSIKSKTLNYDKSINFVVSKILSAVVRVPGCPKGVAEKISHFRLQFRGYGKKFVGFHETFNKLFDGLSDVNLNLHALSSELRRERLSGLLVEALASIKEKNATNHDKITIIDQLMSPKVLYADEYASAILEMSSDYKVIVVKRDPRDQYVDFINKRKKAYHLMSHKDSLNHYIREYKERYDRMNRLMSSQPLENVLCIWFEDLVKDYEFENQKVAKFLGLENHEYKFKYFYPGLAENYVEMYATYKYQQDIAKIADEMHDHLYRKKD